MIEDIRDFIVGFGQTGKNSPKYWYRIFKDEEYQIIESDELLEDIDIKKRKKQSANLIERIVDNVEQNNDPENILFVGPIFRYSSAGSVLRNFLIASNKIGYKVGFDPIGTESYCQNKAFITQTRHLLDKSSNRTKIVFSQCTEEQYFINKPHYKIHFADDFLLTDKYIKKINDHSKGIITGSNWSRNYYNQNNIDNILKVPLGVDFNKFYPKKRDIKSILNSFEWIGNKKNIDEETLIFGTYGFLQERKGITELLSAYVKYFDKNDNVLLIIHTLAAEWGNEIEFEDGLPPILYSSKPISDMNSFINCIDVGVFPSYVEGFGLCPLEMFAADKICIIPKHTGFLEYGNDYNCIWLENFDIQPAKNNKISKYRPFDWFIPIPDEIGEKMRQIYNNRDILKDFSPRQSIADFSWQKSAKILMDAVDGVQKKQFIPDKITTCTLACGEVDKTIKCLKNISKNYDVQMVDNGLNSDDRKQIENKFGSSIKIVQGDLAMGGPLGVTARNLVWENSDAEFIVSIDNDVYIPTDFIDKAVEELKSDPSLAIIGGYVVFAGTNKIWAAGATIGKDWMGSPYFENKDLNSLEMTPLFADYIPTAAVVCRHSAIREVGYLFKEYAPVFYEDPDICYMLRLAGYRLKVIPIIIEHDAETTTSKLSQHFYKSQNVFMKYWDDLSIDKGPEDSLGNISIPTALNKIVSIEEINYDHLVNNFCLFPFTTLEITPSGYSCCCNASPSGSLSWKLGEVNAPLWDAWNNQRMQDARKDLINHQYKSPCGLDNIVCNKMYNFDYVLYNQKNPLTENQQENIERLKHNIQSNNIVLDNYPISLTIHLDFYCNFRCRFCYLDIPRFEDHNYPIVDINKIPDLKDFIRNATQISVLGGEPTLSKNFDNLMEMVDDRKICLITNGSNIEPILKHKDKMGKVIFSIDGATKSTYEYLRKNSRWEVLIENCKTIVKEMPETTTGVSYTVVPANFNEMAPFLDIVEEIGLDNIFFNEAGTSMINKKSELFVENDLIFSEKHMPGYKKSARKLTRKMGSINKSVGFNLRDLGFTSDIYQYQLNELKRSYFWHNIILPDGTKTSGRANNEYIWGKLGLKDLTQKSVLDIGCWDGYFSFECEKLGAQVDAVDLSEAKTFSLLKSITLSDVIFFAGDIEKEETIQKLKPNYDIILMLGLIYHMKHPFLMIERAYKMCDRKIFIESHLEDFGTEEPMAVFYGKNELMEDKTNWWGFNKEAMMDMLNQAGFKNIDMLDYAQAGYISNGRQCFRGIFSADKGDYDE